MKRAFVRCTTLALIAILRVTDTVDDVTVAFLLCGGFAAYYRCADFIMSETERTMKPIPLFGRKPTWLGAIERSRGTVAISPTAEESGTLSDPTQHSAAVSIIDPDHDAQ